MNENEFEYEGKTYIREEIDSKARINEKTYGNLCDGCAFTDTRGKCSNGVAECMDFGQSKNFIFKEKQ
jgi:hypothetical protein